MEETKTDAKLCCKLLNLIDKDQQEYIDELNEIFEWHKEHYGKSILDERLEFKSDCEKENEKLKQQLNKLSMFGNTTENIRLSINHETGKLQRHIYGTGVWFGDFDRVLCKSFITEDDYQRFIDRIIEVYNTEFSKDKEQ